MEAANILSLFGGIALFLFGMSIMGDSLKKVAGNKLEIILYKLSGNTLKAILLGTGVTAVIQSSSATSVMVVGFVNSGMMKVRQAIGVVLGAILGTSITGWILCLNHLGGTGSSVASLLSTEILTGFVALIGIALWMFAKKKLAKNIGGIMMGFAVLMYGMSMMSASISPLRENEQFIGILTSFSNPFLGVLAGLLITSVLQSASAAVGILQALAVTGAITFDIAFPLIMGIGIGASVPVLLSALGASVNGKRTAFAYLIIDVLGALICGTVFYVLNGIFHFSFMSMTMTMVSVALVNTLFRLITLLILSPCLGILEKIVCRLFPDDPSVLAEQADMDKLETRFLDHPAIAIEQSRMVIASMAEKAEESVKYAVEARRTGDAKAIKATYEKEAVLDRYEDKLGTYLTKIFSRDLLPAQTSEINKYLHALSDFERMSDHARNIGEAVEEALEKKIYFSDEANSELDNLEDAILEIMRITMKAFTENDQELAHRIDPLEDVIDDLCDKFKFNHIDRVSRNMCTLQNGFIFNDLLTDYERISDHCSNIAVDIMESGKEAYEKHEYHMSLDEIRDERFARYYEEYMERFNPAPAKEA